MKRLLSLLVMSLMLASCSYLEEIKNEYHLDWASPWSGKIRYEIVTGNDYLKKSIRFINGGTRCNVFTSVSFADGLDKEILEVTSNGPNRLILTEKGSNKAIYKLYFSKDDIHTCEMTWDNHTATEKQYISDKSLSATLNRNIPVGKH